MTEKVILVKKKNVLQELTLGSEKVGGGGNGVCGRGTLE